VNGKIVIFFRRPPRGCSSVRPRIVGVRSWEGDGGGTRGDAVVLHGVPEARVRQRIPDRIPHRQRGLQGGADRKVRPPGSTARGTQRRWTKGRRSTAGGRRRSCGAPRSTSATTAPRGGRSARPAGWPSRPRKADPDPLIPPPAPPRRSSRPLTPLPPFGSPMTCTTVMFSKKKKCAQ